MRTIWMPRMESSNLEVFLRAATPRLPWRSATMDRFEGGPDSMWQLDRKEGRDTAVEYFALADLWEHYAESSAYGLAVPVRFRDTGVTQHFVPYLSAVHQLYTATRTANLTVSRSTGSETDSWSDDSAGARSWDAASEEYDASTYDGVAVSAKQGGYLNFQYREWDSPYDRVPLADKVDSACCLIQVQGVSCGDSEPVIEQVAELAQEYPCLMSLRSAELSPSSWMSVAW